jgi:PIN domain nuclease of toxin-antitoxin system
MGSFLLDTNVLIAVINQTVDRLPVRLREPLHDPDSQLVVSVVSPWEIAIKSSLGKLALQQPVTLIEEMVLGMGATILALTLEQALEVAYPEPATKDPFDRLLIAICACEGLKLLTTDTHLAGHRFVY